MINTLEQLLREKKIIIFGAGTRGKRLLHAFRSIGIENQVFCFAVSSELNSSSNIEGIPLYDYKDPRIDRTGSEVLIALADRSEARLVLETLILNGYNNSHLLSDKVWAELEYVQSICYLKTMEKRSICEKQPFEEPGFFHVKIPRSESNTNSMYLWRFYYVAFQREIEKQTEMFPRNRLLEAFEDFYGPYRILEEELKDINQTEKCPQKKSFRIFMARSVYDRFDIPIELPEWLSVIQVGAALTDQRIANLTDDTENNISHMNRDFSEGTAIYWIWKNVMDADYVGLFHYSRHMVIPDNDITRIADTDLDIILTTPMFSGGQIRDFFMPRYVMHLDWELMEESILCRYPEYADSLEQYHQAFCYPGANLSIMKKEIFDEYASFAFKVLLDVAKYYSDRGIVREDRYAGYLLENLTALFAMHNKDKYKIAFTDFNYFKK